MIRVKAGTPVLEEGKVCDMVFQVISGSVKVYRKLASGKELHLYTVEPGKICVVGLQSCLLWQTSVASAIVTADAELACISAKDFAKILSDEPEMASEVIKFIDESLKTMAADYQKAREGFVVAKEAFQNARPRAG